MARAGIEAATKSAGTTVGAERNPMSAATVGVSTSESGRGWATHASHAQKNRRQQRRKAHMISTLLKVKRKRLAARTRMGYAVIVVIPYNEYSPDLPHPQPDARKFLS